VERVSSGKGDAPEFGRGDPQENFERMTSLARGPRGEQGEQGTKGARGERGLPWRVAWAIVVLFALAGALAALSLFSTAHEISLNNQKFCQVIDATTAVPVARPADPAANPSRVQAWEWYVRFAALGRDLGCN
jgi:hypothetical protein